MGSSSLYTVLGFVVVHCMLYLEVFIVKLLYINIVSIRWNLVNLFANNLQTSASRHHFNGTEFPNANTPHSMYDLFIRKTC